MSRDQWAQTDAKRRYNSRHYEQVMLRVQIGGREVIQALADRAGLSMAEYIRSCVIADAERRGIDVRSSLGGGGSMRY